MHVCCIISSLEAVAGDEPYYEHRPSSFHSEWSLISLAILQPTSLHLFIYLFQLASSEELAAGGSECVQLVVPLEMGEREGSQRSFLPPIILSPFPSIRACQSLKRETTVPSVQITLKIMTGTETSPSSSESLISIANYHSQ